MSYKCYPSYKDSGVAWIGKVPEHWRLSKLKYLAVLTGGGTPSRDEPTFWNGDIPWVSPKDMKAEQITNSMERITEAGLAGSTSTLVPCGRVLIVVRSGILKHTIPIAINEVPVAINQDMKALAFQLGTCSPRFFLRWVQGLNGALLLAWAKQGATVESVEHDYLVATIVPIPSQAEQLAITGFLDHETARIDGLIARKTHFIELLKEKRQALIAHAVTKGLDPTAKMKDSGVEWIGQVPAHWSVPKLRHIAKVQTGVAKGKDTHGIKTVSVPYLRVANVQDGYLDLTDMALIDVPEADLARYLLQPGDVLMNEGGDNDKLGRGHVWRGEIDPCIHQNHVFAVRPFGVSAEWLNAYTGSVPAQCFFAVKAKQTTNLASISSSSLMDLPVPRPPADEQSDILSYLGRFKERINALVEKTNRSVALLKERRAALITAAVTGQIDLREVA